MFDSKVFPTSLGIKNSNLVGSNKKSGVNGVKMWDFASKGNRQRVKPEKVLIPGRHISSTGKPTQLPSPHKRCPIHVGKMYELDDGRMGLCMFMGRTLFNKKGFWVGLQLENAKGKHNGTVFGRKYFLCREGKGIFVRPHRIRRLVTEVFKSNINHFDRKVSKDPHKNRYLRKDTIVDLVELTTPRYSKRGLVEHERRTRYRKSRNNSGSIGYNFKEYDISPDHESMFKAKTLYTEKELHSKYGVSSPKKSRVSDIMKEGEDLHSKWKEAKFDIPSNISADCGLFYTQKELHRNEDVKAEHKPGAIETGLIKGYKRPNFPITSISKEQYLLSYPKSKLHEHDGEHAEHKPGAIEIGKANYNTAKFECDHFIDKRQYGLYHPINELHKRDEEKPQRKEGAIEIGRAKGFHMPDYSVNWDPIRQEQYDLFYNPSELQRNSTRVKASSRSPRPKKKRNNKRSNPNKESKLGSTSSQEANDHSRSNLNKESKLGSTSSHEANNHSTKHWSEYDRSFRTPKNSMQQQGLGAFNENDIDDYLPEGLSLRSSPTVGGILTPFSESGTSCRGSLSLAKVSKKALPVEDEFTDDILNLLRSSIEKRRSKNGSKKNSDGGSSYTAGGAGLYDNLL